MSTKKNILIEFFTEIQLFYHHEPTMVTRRVSHEIYRTYYQTLRINIRSQSSTAPAQHSIERLKQKRNVFKWLCC